MADGSPPERSTTPSDSASDGVGTALYAGVFLGVGFIFLFDTTTHLSRLYGGVVASPLGGWIRVLVTAILGSFCVLAALSVVLDTSTA